MWTTLGNVGLYVITKGVVSVRVGSLSMRQHEELLRHAVFVSRERLCRQKNTIGKAVNEFISTLSVTVMAGTDVRRRQSTRL